MFQELHERKRELQALLYNLATEMNRTTDKSLFSRLEQKHTETAKELNQVRKDIQILVEKKNKEFWEDI